MAGAREMMRMRAYPDVADAVVLEATMAEWRMVRRRLAVMQDGLARDVLPDGDAPGLVAAPPVTRAEALEIVALIDDARLQAELVDQLRPAPRTAAKASAAPMIPAGAPPTGDDDAS